MTDAFFDQLQKLQSAKDAAELQSSRPILVELLEKAAIPVEEAQELVINAILDWVERDRKPGLVHFVEERCRKYAIKPPAPKEFSPSRGAAKVWRARDRKPR